MSSRGRRLRSIVRIALHAEEAAAAELEASNRKLANQRLSERLITESRDTHRGHLDAALGEGSAGFRLKLVFQSLSNLESGLTQLAGKIARADDQRTRHLQAWVEKRARRQALEKAVERITAAERTTAERRTEHESSDQSARRQWSRTREES